MTRTIVRWGLASVVGAMVATFAGPVEAQYFWGPARQQDPVRGLEWPRGEVGLELDAYTASEGSATFTPVTVLVGGTYRVIDTLALELVLGMSNVSISVGDESRSWTSVTNPYVAAHYVQASGATRFRVGGGIALPLADDDDDIVIYNWFLRGLRDVWLFLPYYVGVVLSTRVETDIAEGGAVMADAEIGTLIPSGEGADETEVLLQLGGEVAARVGPHLLVGGRLTASWLMTESEGDRDYFQTAVVGASPSAQSSPERFSSQ